MIGSQARAEGSGEIGKGSNDLVAAAERALAAGEVIAIPTDTVYGLAARIDRPESIERLYHIKARPDAKAIPVLLDSVSRLDLVTTVISPQAVELARSFWPGALTIVFAARDGLPARLTSTGHGGQHTIAVRVPDHDLARQIIHAAGGALAVTSANVSGEEPATSAAQVELSVGRDLGLIVDGGTTRAGVPSTIVDLSGADIRILRHGAITAEAIHAALSGPSGAGAV